MPESLKNILLVMADGGYLASPTQDPSKEKIWMETQKRLDRFLPHLFGEIFPPAAAAEPEGETPSDHQPEPSQGPTTSQTDHQDEAAEGHGVASDGDATDKDTAAEQSSAQ